MSPTLQWGPRFIIISRATCLRLHHRGHYQHCHQTRIDSETSGYCHRQTHCEPINHHRKRSGRHPHHHTSHELVSFRPATLCSRRGLHGPNRYLIYAMRGAVRKWSCATLHESSTSIHPCLFSPNASALILYVAYL
jgi:hypothetical protein